MSEKEEPAHLERKKERERGYIWVTFGGCDILIDTMRRREWKRWHRGRTRTKREREDE